MLELGWHPIKERGLTSEDFAIGSGDARNAQRRIDIAVPVRMV
jgi:hypothetical protein